MRLPLRAAPYIHDSITPSQVKHPTTCILLIEESQETIDDGCWAWQPAPGAGVNVPSVRHDKSARDLINQQADPTVGRTNAGFVDGHADWIPRSDTFAPEFYDPTK